MSLCQPAGIKSGDLPKPFVGVSPAISWIVGCGFLFLFEAAVFAGTGWHVPWNTNLLRVRQFSQDAFSTKQLSSDGAIVDLCITYMNPYASAMGVMRAQTMRIKNENRFCKSSLPGNRYNNETRGIDSFSPSEAPSKCN
jgi:hypothetical protein